MKKIFMLAATAAIALSSCSKNEVLEAATPNDNPNTIGLSVGTFTTKAGETTTTSLNKSGNTIKIYSSDPVDATTPFGTRTFTYSDGDGWTVDSGKTTWSGVGFPLSLFSLNNGASGILLPDDLGPDVSLAAAYADYTVKATTSEQEDLIYYGAQLAAIPLNGVINATFKHALSRVMMQCQASVSYNTINFYVASVKLVQVDGTSKPSIRNDATITWADSSSDLVNDADASYTYFTNSATETALTLDSRSYTSFSESISDMYIIPQTTEAFDKASTATSSYVEVVYRSQSTTGINIVGYDLASNHPQYISSDDDWSAIASSPLYVKVAFPVDETTLTDGVYYNFVLDFDGGDIEVAEDGFFTEEGNSITIPTGATAPKEEDIINPDAATTTIGLSINIIDWPSATDSDL